MFALLFQLVAAGAPDTTYLLDNVKRISLYSCYVGLRRFPWLFKLPRGGDYTCDYEPAFEALLYCMYQNIQEHGHSNSTFQSSFENVRSFCDTSKVTNFTDAQFFSSFNNGSIYIQDQQIPGANITYPVKVNPRLRKGYYAAYHGYYYNRDIGNYFGSYLCAYFVGVMLLAGALRFLRLTPLQKTIFKLKVFNNIRGWGLIPNLGKKHAEPFTYFKIITGYLPTRFELLVVLGYLVLHTAFMACNYRYDPHNIIFKSHALQIARFVGDRSAVLAFAHFPLIVLFAGRNNFLEMISGIPYTSFITFHKWVGRIMFLDAVVHAVAYTRFVILRGTYARVIKRVYWRFGIVALVFGGAILLTSFAYCRRHYYESFLLIHIVLGALFFYACWQHVLTISGIEWIYAAIALWCFDRLVRIIRICSFGFPTAKLRLVSEDLVRVTIPKSSKIWKAKPGQYVFISFLHPWCFWQSHPFTVMDSCSEEGELTIIFKEKKGVTKYLKKYLATNNGEVSMRVAVEGPYGHSSPLHRFDNVLLLSGGIGLPGPMHHAIDLGKTCAASGKKKIQLVATTKGFKALEAFKPELAVLKNKTIDVYIYDTSKLPPLENSSTSTSDEDQNAKKQEENEKQLEKSPSPENLYSDDDSATELGFASLHQGRPNFRQLLDDSSDQAGSLAVICCGPPAFVDSVRNETARLIIEKPNSVIEYFEEYQAW